MGYNPEENDLKYANTLLSEQVEELRKENKELASERYISLTAELRKENKELAEELKEAKRQEVQSTSMWVVLNDENEELGRKLKFWKEQAKTHEETIDLQVKLNNSLERQRIDLEDKVERLELLNRRTEEQLGQFKVLYSDESEENITLCADLKAMTGRFDDVAELYHDLVDENTQLRATVIDQAMKIAGVKL